MIVRIDPALPCGTVSGDSICGRPATVAHVDPGTNGTWIMLPICKQCTEATARMYGVHPDQEKTA
jgi:hypothetical protein